MRTRLDVQDGIARLTIDDAKVNALSETLLREVEARLNETMAAQATVLFGRPGIFSAGFDMATFPRGADATVGMLRAGIDLIAKMLSHPHPIVIGCAGHAFPMGAFLLLSADIRLGVPGPFKIGMNEVAIGLTVPHFALALAKHQLNPVGFARITTGRMFSPEEAVRLGYLDEVVPAAQLEAAALAAAEELSTVDPVAYRGTKARMYGSLVETLTALGRPEALAEELREIEASR